MYGGSSHPEEIFIALVIISIMIALEWLKYSAM